MNVTNENRFWLDFITGSHEAFKGLYNAYADVLFRYGCLYTQDRNLVQDCIHDLFVDLHRYRTGLDPKVNVKAYLLASMKRKVLASLKKSPTYTLTELQDGQAIWCDVSDTESGIIRVEEERAVAKRVRAELAKLPARQREVLHLKFDMELPYAEISHLMEISEATCRTLVYRAIKRLRKNIKTSSLSPF